MAEFVEVMKNITRLCKTNRCENCILRDSGFCGANPNKITEESFKETEKIAMKWAKDHPIQTNADKFETVGILIKKKISNWR